MQIEQKEKIAQALCDVTEKMAFMFGEEAEQDELLEAAQEGLEVKISFSGRDKGEITMLSTPDMGVELAANVLGIDHEEINQEIIEDSLKEWLNVTCGHILTTLAGSEAIYDLSAPEVRTVDSEIWDTSARDANAMLFLIDDQPMILMVHCEGLVGRGDNQSDES